MKTSRGHVGAGSRFRQASNVMRHELTFHVLRLTFVGASLNVVLTISILILIRILFTKQNPGKIEDELIGNGKCTSKTMGKGGKS